MCCKQTKRILGYQYKTDVQEKQVSSIKEE